MIPEKTLPNGGSVALTEVPSLSETAFHQYVVDSVRAGARVSALFGVPADGGVRRYALLAWKTRGLLSLVSSDAADRYAALTPECEQVHLFEREMAEQWRLEPVGHPWLKPVRYERPRRDGRDLWQDQGQPPACGVAGYFQIEGEEVHEVAVGPVHAGIIEPGHFRFQCHGETVHHLEIMLGYQHRGIERALPECPREHMIYTIETAAGDTTVGHTFAHCRAMEALGRSHVPARAQVIRGIALELERIANHIGDLGALAGDIGFLPTMSYCGRIRGDILNLTATLCGNRFGRGLLRPGGVGFDVDADTCAHIGSQLQQAMQDAESAIGLLWEAPSVLARFEGTGPLSYDTATRIGLVGPVARASGGDVDVRRDFPYGVYRMAQLPVCLAKSGDVFARAFVRWKETVQSAGFIAEQLAAMPEGPVRTECEAPLPGRLAVALVEGWRGEICHVAVSGEDGRISQYKIVDPSFHNWFGLAYALRGQEISDFPVCNKSFNLSYCGHDL